MSLTIHPISSGISLLYIIVLSSATANKRISLSLSLSHRYGKSHAMGSHSVTCHPTTVTFPPSPQPKLITDLATPEGCKAEMIWVMVIC